MEAPIPGVSEGPSLDVLEIPETTSEEKGIHTWPTQFSQHRFKGKLTKKNNWKPLYWRGKKHDFPANASSSAHNF
jgi:hypothetical protein